MRGTTATTGIDPPHAEGKQPFPKLCGRLAWRRRRHRHVFTNSDVEGLHHLLDAVEAHAAVTSRFVALDYRGCNYFSNIENACDEAHIHFTHRGTEEGRERLFVALPEISAEETEYGIARYGKRPTGETRVTHFGMPNMHHIAGASQSIHWRVPITDEYHAIPTITLRRTGETHGDAFGSGSGDGTEIEDPWAATHRIASLGDAVLAGKMELDEVQERRHLIQIQDWVTQVGQGRIADRVNERLGSSDQVIVLLRSIWARELRALAEGRPLKVWRRPDQLLAALGA